MSGVFKTQRDAWIALNRVASEHDMTATEATYSIIADWLMNHNSEYTKQPYLSCEHKRRVLNRKYPDTKFCRDCGMAFWKPPDDAPNVTIPKLYGTKNSVQEYVEIYTKQTKEKPETTNR